MIFFLVHILSSAFPLKAEMTDRLVGVYYLFKKTPKVMQMIYRGMSEGKGG